MSKGLPILAWLLLIAAIVLMFKQKTGWDLICYGGFLFILLILNPLISIWKKDD